MELTPPIAQNLTHETHCNSFKILKIHVNVTVNMTSQGLTIQMNTKLKTIENAVISLVFSIFHDFSHK